MSLDDGNELLEMSDEESDKSDTLDDIMMKIPNPTDVQTTNIQENKSNDDGKIQGNGGNNENTLNEVEQLKTKIQELQNELKKKDDIINELRSKGNNNNKKASFDDIKINDDTVIIDDVDDEDDDESIDFLKVPDLKYKNMDNNNNNNDYINKDYKGHLLLWSGTTKYKDNVFARNDYNAIKLINLKKLNQKINVYKMNLYDINSIKYPLNPLYTLKNYNTDKFWFGYYSVSNIDLPKWIIDKATKTASKFSLFSKSTPMSPIMSPKSSNVESKDDNSDNKDNNENKVDSSNDNNNDSDCVFNVKRKNYSMIFRVGGAFQYNKQRTNETDLIIYNHRAYNKNLIDSYFVKLNNIPVPVSSNAVIFNKYNNINTVYSIGGSVHNKITRKIYSLDMNKFENSWTCSDTKLRYARNGCCVELIDYNKMIIIGGKSKNGNKKLKSCELFMLNKSKYTNTDNPDNKTINIANLQYARCFSGILKTNINKERIIIGGGWSGVKTEYNTSNREEHTNWHNNVNTTKSLELYDCNKNKWYLFPALTNYEHIFNPILWHDTINNNPNVIFIGGDSVGIDSKSLLGNIEYIDMRSNDKRWMNFKHLYPNNNKLTKLDNIAKLFQIDNDDIFDEKLWRSRAILIH